MEQTEAPPVEGDVAPVEADVEAEAVPGEGPEPAPAPANDAPAPASAADAAEGDARVEPKEGAQAHFDGRDGPSAGAGDDDGEEPAGDGGAGDAEEDEPLEPDADAPNADESEWDTLTRLGFFTRGASSSSSSGGSIDALVDELVDQSMNTDGSDLELGLDADDIHDAPASGSDPARPDASSPHDERPSRDDLDELVALDATRRELAERNAELERAVAAHLSRAKTSAYSGGTDREGGGGAGTTGMDDGDDAEAAQRKIRYRNALAGWRRARDEIAFVADEHEQKRAEVQADLDARSARRDATVKAFETYKAEVAKAAEYPGNPGKGLSDETVEARLSEERAADAIVRRERVANARLRRRLARTEEKVRDKEELAAGLFLVDFEQLKIENGALQEKIDARNEDLVRLRAKTGLQVQTLTHMKEKLQHVKKEIERMVRELAELAEESDKKGDHMRRLKAERDRYKKENERMQAASNTVDTPVLLDDYRYLKQKSTHLRQKVARLQRMCAEAQAIKTSRTPRSGTKSKTPAVTPKPDATPAGGVGFF